MDNPIYARLMRTPIWYTRPDARRINVWIAVASRLEETIERRSQVGI